MVVAALAVTASGDADERRANRLAHESSPHLLQHVLDPVDWRAWGPEAFEAARRAGKPIYLCIGTATSSWCQVLRRACFEDETIAAILDEHFVAILVDREERPGVAAIYAEAARAMIGDDGLPISVVLDPVSLEPYHAVRFQPSATRDGRPAFRDALLEAAGLWRTDRAEANAAARRVAATVRARLLPTDRTVELSRAEIDRAVDELLAADDPISGGFDRARRKLPRPSRLRMLMEVGWRDPEVRFALQRTLDRMATGGIYDQVGGGFHHASTDARWQIPRFEKLLCDNGQLASVYAIAYERTGNRFYEEIARETLDYVLREMTQPAGGFSAAQDAEAGGREGAHYVWTRDEIRTALAAAGLRREHMLADTVYGLRRASFRAPHHPEAGFRIVLHLRDRPDVTARRLGIQLDVLNERIAAINGALLAARERRGRPQTDDSVLTSWNGLMITAMVDGARALGEPRYLEAAERAARFVLETHRDGQGLRRVSRGGRARIDAGLEDYALLAQGLLALHRATGERRWLVEAERLVAEARRRFRGDGGRHYFDAAPDRADLFVRPTSTHDGVMPCGASVLLLDLLDLHELTGDAAHLDEAARLLAGLAPAVATDPTATALTTIALARFLDDHPGRMPAARPLACVPDDAPAPRGPADTPVRRIDPTDG